MYQDFFSFTEAPFAIVPNPKFFFLSERHKEALSHMLSGISGGGGLALLTGEVGTGKTMTMRALLARLPTKSQVLTIVNPNLSEYELLQTICDGFELAYAPNDSFKNLLDAITERLYENESKGINSILLVDEAQHLKAELLELLRLLTNIETKDYKLLKVILIGQPELHQLLRQENLRQLAQRITERYQLMPLPEDELKQYILHRLICAGQLEPIFNDDCFPIFCRYTGGVPRLINLVCDQALKIAYREGKRYVTAEIATQACQHVIEWQTGIVVTQPKKVANLKPYYKKAVHAAGAIFIISSLTLFIRSTLLPEPDVNNESSQTMAELSPLIAPEVDTPEPLPVVSTPVEPEVAELTPKPKIETISFSNLTNQSMSMGVAVQNLYQQWGYQADEMASSCRAETRANLSCYRTNLQFNQIVNINRPAVLVMNGANGKLWYALVSSLDEEKVELVIGRSQQSVLISKDFLREYWTGEAMLLWRPPYGNTSMISMGQRGNRVLWLDERLNLALGGFDQASNYFDQNVKNKVLSFQVQQDMDVDGIAGPLTIMMLDGVLGLAGPTLHKGISLSELELASMQEGKLLTRAKTQGQKLALRPMPEFVAAVTQTEPAQNNKQPKQPQPQIISPQKANDPPRTNTTELALGNELLDINQLDFSDLSPALAQRVENALIQVAKTPEYNEEEPEPTNQNYSNVIRISDLPSHMLQRLPPMNFQAHVYASDPTNRWVKVNNKNVTEGQIIGKDVLLRGVEPHQIVIQFENKLISIPALSTW